MKVGVAAAVALFLRASGVAAGGVDPLGAVFQLLADLKAKIAKEGEDEAKAFDEYTSWCRETTQNGEFAVKTTSKQKATLEAKIAELTSASEAADGKIEDLAAAVAAAQAQLKKATEVRRKEAADFATSEAELDDAVRTLAKAITILEREAAKNPGAAFAQVDTAGAAKTLQALSAVLDAASLSGSDQKRLVALAQQHDQAEDAEFGAPSAAAYSSKSGGIVDVLEDMKEKADSQLESLRKAEVSAQHNFAMVEQSLTDQMKADSADLEEHKAAKASAGEDKAAAQGDLQRVVAALASATKALETARSSCITEAADHEATVASRTEELRVLEQARKTLEESTSGAASLLQLAVRHRRASFIGAASKVVDMVKRLAKQQKSTELAQLASRMAAASRLGSSSGEDPFGKIKSLITDLIAKLESEASSDAEEKAYCDEQLQKTREKKAELDDDISKMSTTIDKADAKSAQLKEQIQEVQKELAALMKEQAEADKLRSETHANYEAAKSELETGLTGVRKALSTLREYYGAAAAASLLQVVSSDDSQQPAPPQRHSKSTDAGTSIIQLLEVCESDLAKSLAEEETQESDAQSDYEKNSKVNEVSRTGKEQDVAGMTREAASLAKTAAEYGSDRDTTSSELSAVEEYLAKVEARCIAKPESYKDRTARREAEIRGLKQALSTLKDETALVQKRRKGGNFRGTLAAN